MRSAGLCAAPPVGAGRSQVGERALRIISERSEVGQPVDEAGVLVPFGQVAGDDVLVGGFEGLPLGLGGGLGVDLGGGQLDVPQHVADVGQRHACLVKM